MQQGGQIDQHIHLRKRRFRHTNVEYPYPSSNKAIQRLDRLMLVVGIIGPFASLPQVIEIYTKHSVDGVSLLSWIFYGLLNILWLVYALAHKERVIIINQIMLIIFNVLVISGVLIYG